jgi:hypothetical protein
MSKTLSDQDLINCSLCDTSIDPDIFGVFKDGETYYFYHINCLDDWTNEHLDNITHIKTVDFKQIKTRKQIKAIKKQKEDIEKDIKSRKYKLFIDEEYVCDFDYNGKGKQKLAEQLDKALKPSRCGICMVGCLKCVVGFIVCVCLATIMAGCAAILSYD